MKKRILSLIAAIVLLVVFVLSAVSCDKPRTLNVYNWGEYISDGSDDSFNVNKGFEEYYLATFGEKVKVNYTTFASNEDMYAKLKSGAVSYDVVVPSDYMIELMIEEGMLAEIDFNNIPNYQYIISDYKNLFYDPQNKYSVPYTYGTVGIIYNTKVVTGNPSSWSLMWDAQYTGQILNFNNPRDGFATAMYKLGIDVNTTDIDEWNKVLDAMKAQKPLVQSYVMDEVFNKMKNGSAAIAPYYAGDFLTMYADNNDLAFYYPSEGTNVFVDAMCIPKNAANKDLAEAYINYMLTEEAAIANAEYICYASPNSLVRQNAEYKAYLEELHPDAFAILYPEENGETVMMSYYYNLPAATREYMNSLWEELKIENPMGGTIYIVAGVIVAVIAVGIVAFVIVKKKRADYDDVDEDEDDEDDAPAKKK